MGTYWYLIDDENKEKFDLGKGYWNDVFPDEEMIVFDEYSEEQLYCKILGEVAHTFADNTPIGYFRKVSEKIYKWCENRIVSIRSDITFDELGKYETTGSRFDK